MRSLLTPIAVILMALILLMIGLLLGASVVPFVAVVAVLAAVGLPLIRRGARRYEQQELQNGDWDTTGPKHPTPMPRNFWPRVQSNGLAFDLEHGTDRDSDWPGGVKPHRPPGDSPPPNDR